MAAAGDKEATASDRSGGRRGAVEWSDLTPDVLRLISRKLTIWDYVRFRGVCSSWRSAASPVDRPFQLPCLLLPYDLGTTARSFFDPSDRQVRTIDLPEARGKWLYGTPYGWLVIVGKEEEGEGGRITVSLLNPITRAQISFPPLPDELRTLPEQHGDRYAYSTKPILTANPASSCDHQRVLLALLIFKSLAFFRLGGEMWTVIDLSIHSRFRVFVEFTYLEGAFYVVDLTKGITVLNTRTLKKRYSAPPSSRMIPDYNTIHLVESSGDLLLLESCNTGFDSLKKIEVFKLDRSRRKLKWVSVEESIGGRALFVSHKNLSISLCSGDFLGCREDLIYFAVHDLNKGSLARAATVCVLDIVAGSSIGHQPYYWQASTRPYTILEDLIGLTWIIPSLS